MPDFKTGLIVGKFSPLHLGHEFVINSALKKCERLYLLSYSKPELKHCSPERRMKWLSAVAPNAEILVVHKENREAHGLPTIPDNAAGDTAQRDFVARVCRDVFTMCPEAVFTSEDYGDGFAAYLQSYFDQPVQHVCVDLKRKVIPISATQIRENVYDNRKFLSTHVFTDFVKTVCFLGAESTGKSTLSEKLSNLYNTNCVREYGRELWEQKNGKLDYADFATIAQTHILHESAAKETANQFVFIDTSPLTTLFYCHDYFGRSEPELNKLSNHQYDYVFLCHPDFPLVQDGTRQSEDFRHEQHQWYMEELSRRNIPFVSLLGTLQEKIHAVQGFLFSSE